MQHLTSNTIDPVARVCITTIQRLYSMLQGEAELDPSLEEGSLFDSGAAARSASRCPSPTTRASRSRPSTSSWSTSATARSTTSGGRCWSISTPTSIGLTATPSKQTFGFFNQNLVMEYNHEQAVADGVNVDFDVYRIRTRITGSGSTIEAGFFVGKRDG